ncbi:uncharacterized protein [Euwallacea similis]|uniref:uncharacterized protein n=1 Tax=Euwallacea similis TaxID=1736056 RepID=UPI00344C6015
MRLFILMLISHYYSVAGVPVLNNFSNNENQLLSSNFPLTIFTQSLYRANIASNFSIEFPEDSVTISNLTDQMYVVVTSDNYADYAIHLGEPNEDNLRKVELKLISSNPISKEFDVVVLEGLNENLVPVCRTAILLLNTNTKVNMYKTTFMVNGQEYIILNLFYFKWFLGLLILTGLLILLVELHEVLKHLNDKRKNYARLPNSPLIYALSTSNLRTRMDQI